MKCIEMFPLTFSLALIIGSGASSSQSANQASSAGQVALSAEYHPGEGIRYAFSQKMNLTVRVDPRTHANEAPPLTPRQYRVDGEIVATFAVGLPGEPLRGTMQFQGLSVSNWVSTAQVADLEACLHKLESTPLALATGADGNLRLSEVPPHLIQDRYVLDVEDLRSIAQALFISRISSQPLAKGQQRESADFPIPGMIKPGIRMTILTEYVADIPIARRPNAEVRLSMNVPYQARAVSSESNAAEMSERLGANGVWTYLLDLDGHRISFLYKTIQSETGYSLESSDNNEPVRIALPVFTVNKEYAVTARRVVADTPPEREADLAAFEKSLQAPPHSATEGSGATPVANPVPEVSLGDLARRLRAGGAAPASAGGSNVPAGFKEQSFPSGDKTVFVPAQAFEVERTKTAVTLRVSFGISKPDVTIVLEELPLDPARSNDDTLNGIISGLQVRQSEKKNLNGMPAVVMEAFKPGELATQVLQSYVISRGSIFRASCGTSASEFRQVESLCRTVVESIRAR